MKIEFDTTAFEASHGKAPRGTGSWAFGTSRNADPANPEAVFFSPGGMTLAAAKKWAREEIARRFGADASGTLHVLP